MRDLADVGPSEAIQRNGADFINGSVAFGIMLALIPVATEPKTVYFSCGEATEATGETGTRYALRTGNDTYTPSGSGGLWAFENLGKDSSQPGEWSWSD